MTTATSDQLAENFGRSLSLMQEIGSTLSDLETTLRVSKVDQIDDLLNTLEEKQEASDQLACERNSLLPDRSEYETCAELFPVERRREIASTIEAMRSVLAKLRKQQERVWVMMTVRATIVDHTIRLLVGGSAEAYDASGRMSSSTAKPLLQQRRC